MHWQMVFVNKAVLNSTPNLPFTFLVSLALSFDILPMVDC